MPNTPETSQETLKDKSIFTAEEKAALAEFLELFEVKVDPEQLTDGYIIELCENTPEQFDNPPFYKEIGLLLKQTVEKAKKASLEMQENIAELACKIPPLSEGEKVIQYRFRYTQNRSRYPFKIRTQMATMMLKTLINNEEEVNTPEGKTEKDKQIVRLMESYIAALNYWSKITGLNMKFEEYNEQSEEARKHFFKAVSRASMDFRITGTIENAMLNHIINRLKKALMKKGVISKKPETEIQNDTKLEIAIAMKNQ